MMIQLNRIIDCCEIYSATIDLWHDRRKAGSVRAASPAEVGIDVVDDVFDWVSSMLHSAMEPRLLPELIS